MQSDEESSHRIILRSFSKMGLASIAQAVSSLVRLKIVALIFGPAGVGQFGLMLSMTQTVAQCGILGQDTAAPRRFAEVESDRSAFVQSFWAVAILVSFLAAIVGVSIWLLRVPLGALVGMEVSKLTAAWVVVAAVLSILSIFPVAVLQGLRQITELAQLQVIAHLSALLMGVMLILSFGLDGLLPMISMTPGCLLFFGLLFIRKQIPFGRLTRDVCVEMERLISNGMPIMVTVLTSLVATLTVRAAINHTEGHVALGLYTAATAVGTAYISLILGAFSADFLPRLAAIVGDPEKVRRLLSEQSEMIQLVISPIVIALIGFAPWILSAMFSNKFIEAVPVLQWQVLSDGVKAVFWPLGVLLLASGKGIRYLAIECISQAIFIFLTTILITFYGLEYTSLAFVVLAGAQILLTVTSLQSEIKFQLDLRRGLLMVCTTTVCISLIALSEVSVSLSAIGGAAFSIIFARHGILRLRLLTNVK